MAQVNKTVLLNAGLQVLHGYLAVMRYSKFQANRLFTGTEMLPGNHVLITNEQGVVEAIIDEQDAGDDIQQLQGILSPGLVNCHCHLELSHMKGLIPEHTGLVDFVFKVVTQRHFADEEILDAVAAAENEMLNNGIVAVGDICNNTLTIPQKQLQRIAYYNFIEVSGWNPAIAATRFARSMEMNAEYTRLNAPHSVSPHAPYSVSNELWDLLQLHFAGKTITIHNQETAFEDSLFLQGEGDFLRMYEMMKLDISFFRPTGKSSLQSYYGRMGNARNVLLVHNTFTKEEDLLAVHSAHAADQSAFFCLCPNANQYIENAMPPVDLLRKHNCNIVLGTDSLASNWSLNILDEMKTINKHFPSIALEEMLQWATMAGARALQMEDKLGSFTKGKQPGIVCLGTNFDCIKRLL